MNEIVDIVIPGYNKMHASDFFSLNFFCFELTETIGGDN